MEIPQHLWVPVLLLDASVYEKHSCGKHAKGVLLYSMIMHTLMQNLLAGTQDVRG